jgi:hypothetical protein
MKTIKQITTEITHKQILLHIASSYVYKMGGTRTLIIDGVEVLKIDNREYYSGRGAKQNTSIRYDNQIYKLTSQEVIKLSRNIAKELYAEAKRCAANQKAERERLKVFKECAAKGVYPFNGSMVMLSDAESYNRSYNVDKLARTLNISREDAKLVGSEGKTYVFAKTNNGEYLRIFHPCLCCNPLYIHTNPITIADIVKFNRDWRKLDNINEDNLEYHFVC